MRTSTHPPLEVGGAITISILDKEGGHIKVHVGESDPVIKMVRKNTGDSCWLLTADEKDLTKHLLGLLWSFFVVDHPAPAS